MTHSKTKNKKKKKQQKSNLFENSNNNSHNTELCYRHKLQFELISDKSEHYITTDIYVYFFDSLIHSLIH